MKKGVCCQAGESVDVPLAALERQKLLRSPAPVGMHPHVGRDVSERLNERAAN